MQRIGDRAGEAATFHNLRIVSWNKGLTQEGIRLVALSYLINSSIGHEGSQLSFKNLSDMASQLKYSQESFNAMQKEVAESYARTVAEA